MLLCGAAFAQDALKDAFISPPESYGPVPFFWWTGEPLNRDRIAWELDQLKAKGFSGVNINYTHTMLGHSYKGSPPLFSDRWWEFWEGIVEECAKRNMTIGFDDYIVTHGNPDLATVGGQIHRKNPETAGLLLRQQWRDVKGGDAFTLSKFDREPVVAMAAYRFEEGGLAPDSRVDLEPGMPWTPPAGRWRISILYTEPQAYGVMNPLYARQVIARYFELFERHSRGLFGKAVNYFFRTNWSSGG